MIKKLAKEYVVGQELLGFHETLERIAREQANEIEQELNCVCINTFIESIERMWTQKAKITIIFTLLFK